ncbi:uncharacterized protein LOC111395142 [Olea europaea var. sylvestris]|uniref:uncharacterized protein LOC111395142 n=1 Tax=Olea europaea var. sylvestris TaxID=158386 RepID=UPI000C1D2191|nr:uncharacterized protein LOC111395142 [Olea europaea var. sylvestris]
MEINDMKELKWPASMKSSPDNRDRSKYCEFHRDHGHTTEDCKALQQEIEALIKRGFLSNYVGHDKCPRNDYDKRKEFGAESYGQPMTGTINIIIGGITSEKDTNSVWKQCAQQCAHASKEFHYKLEHITFRSRDLEGVSYLHDDALVISAIVANFEVKNILIDNGSAANILSHDTFTKMGISAIQLKAVRTLLQGFGDGVIILQGIVEFPLILGSDKA